VALSVPSTQTVSDNIIAAIEAEIGKSIPLLPKSFTRVLSKALAGIFVLVYKYGAWSLLQQFVTYASFRETTVNDRTFVPLIEWGRLSGIGDPDIATNSQCTVSFGVLNQDSSTVPAGAQLVHPSTGYIYITLTDVVLDAGTKQVDVLAASDPDGNGGSGTLGNRADGDILKWANPRAQLSTVGATVTTTTVTAADAETEAAYRQRVVDIFAYPPKGGAYADYRIWGTEVEGIINIYPYTGVSPGTVDVYAEATEASSVDGEGTPTTAQLEAVAAAIELDSSGLATRRPVSAYVNFPEAISRQPFDVTVTGLAADDTVAAQTVIADALDDHFRSREPFILGLSKLPRLDRVTQAAVSGVVDEAVSTVGGTVTSVALTLSGASITAYTLDFGQKAKLGSTPTFI
jgi:uncharacterized phage protein gp47/JayE